MEANPDFILVACDVRNAFNEASRKSILEQVWSNEDLKELFYITYLLLHGKFYVGSGSGTGVRHTGFDSETGVQQGAVDASYLFCLLIAVANKQTDELLSPVGGAIVSGMDDTYLLGPAEEVFSAIR